MTLEETNTTYKSLFFSIPTQDATAVIDVLKSLMLDKGEHGHVTQAAANTINYFMESFEYQARHQDELIHHIHV